MREQDVIDTIAPISAGAPAPGSKYDRLIARAKETKPAITMVAHPCDESSLRGAIEAAQLGIIKPVLVGPSAKISKAAHDHGINIGGYEIVDAPHSEAAAAKAEAVKVKAKAAAKAGVSPARPRPLKTLANS